MVQVEKEIMIGGATWIVKQDDLTEKISLCVGDAEIRNVVKLKYKDDQIPLQKGRMRRLEIVIEEIEY